MSIKIKTEIEKEVNIGDTLTPEEAQKYIEAGGFVKHVVIYAMINNILNYYVDNQWLLSREPNLADVSSGIIFTAVENPEKQKKQDDKAVIKELQENCGSLTKEVEDLKSQLAITKTELVTIERNTDRLADENAELKDHLAKRDDQIISALALVKTIQGLYEAERKKSDQVKFFREV